MKTIVFAYHSIGCVGIEALIEAGFEILAVFTHPDDPKETIWFDSVADLAVARGIPVHAPEDVNHPLWVERIRNLEPDAIFSFYYRKLLGRPILDVPPAGAFNLHGSLLPAYRGRCPVNWVLLNGETRTGVTLHHMTERPDAGDIVAQRAVNVDRADDAKSLFGKLADASRELLRDVLPQLASGNAPRTPQDESKASRFGGRKPSDGLIDWSRDAESVRNLVRAVTKPYPGAFSFLGDRKCLVWKAETLPENEGARPGTVLSTDPLVVTCAKGALRLDTVRFEGGVSRSGRQFAAEALLHPGMRFSGDPARRRANGRKTKVLILGVSGFIGSHLSERLLDDGNYEVYGLDLQSDYVEHLLDHPDFRFREGDVSIHNEWIEYHVRKCDVILPLVAIATPIEYVRNPLRVFELDFEENLRTIRACAKYAKRVVFPSTSEVYGMCPDERFDEESSPLVTGPIKNQRWIYSSIKQLLDRVIWAYGERGDLDFTLFRPFNWIGPRLDSLDSARIGSSRAITQLILNLCQGTPIRLVDGGRQKRAFVDVDDAIEALFRIVENRDGRCSGKIVNVGYPENEASIRELAELLVEQFEQHPLRDRFPPFAGMVEVESEAFYGKGYQDMRRRVPNVRNAKRHLGWEPKIALRESVAKTLDFFLRQAVELGLSE